MTLILGKDAWRFRVRLPPALHHQAIYVLGRPGQGKSWLLINLALQAHALGEGVLAIDTKDGQLAEELAARSPHPEDILYVAPGRCFWPTRAKPDGELHYWGINILEYDRSQARRAHSLANQIANNVLDVFQRVGQLEGFMTQVEDRLETSVRLALAKPGSTLIDVRQVLTDPDAARKILDEYATLPEVRSAWEDFLNPKKTTQTQRYQAVTSTVPRIRRWMFSPVLNFTVSQPKSTLKIAEWLDQGKMVICDLHHDLDHRDGVRLANLILGLAVNAGFARQDVEKEDKRHWRFILDEFHRLASPSFGEMLNAGRSQRIWPVMAHQTLGQLSEIRTHHNELFTSVTGAGVQITLALGYEDQRHFRQLRGEEVGSALEDLPRYQARVEVPGSPRDSGFPITVELLPLSGTFDADQLRSLIDRQRPYTQPEHVLAAENRRRYYATPTRGTTVGHGQPSKPPPTQEAAQPVPARPPRQGAPAIDDRAEHRDSPPPGPVSLSRKRPNRKPPV